MSNRLEPPHYNNLDAILPSAWALLRRGVRDHRSDSHILNVSTLTAEGLPTIRSVVLRGFEEKTRTLKFHTDSRSDKATEIFERSQIAVHLYDKKEKIQLRFQCRSTLHHRDPISGRSWRGMRDMSRQCYRQAIAPGAPLETPTKGLSGDAVTSIDAAYDNFALISAVILKLEWLYLSSSGHRRVLIDWRDGKECKTWLAP